MTRAAIYVRVSTVRQAERDLSLPDQIAQCTAFCERQGWEVGQVFSEPGASALDEDRPAFQELIYKATASDRPFSFVVVHSLSRFSRDSLHSELYVRKLRKAGVELVSVTQTVTPDASGEMFRKLLNVFDEHQSRENAKHVHRAMCENTRQGFWNGSRPPFGYRTVTAERRGNKDKRVLAIEPDEARIVRQIFTQAAGSEGRPQGVKAIASWLNERGVTRRGRPFSTGSIHDILTAPTYFGQHYFNRRDSRNGTPRPPSQWIALSVPAIVDEATFNTVQALLRSRDPRRTPPRVVNGPTFLAGLARCGYCGAALIQNTGKGGQYRYYCCSRRLKEGGTSCRGIRMPMDRLDRIVLDEVTERVLHPTRLAALLEAFSQSAIERTNRDKERLTSLRRAQRDCEAGITRLIEMVEKGLMEADDALLRDRLVALKVQRDEASNEAAAIQKRMSSAAPPITFEKIRRVGRVLSDKLYHGPSDLRQAYARLLLDEVSVTDDEIRISGSKSALARCAAADDPPPASPNQVLSFVREWRARKDSNL